MKRANKKRSLLIWILDIVNYSSLWETDQSSFYHQLSMQLKSTLSESNICTKEFNGIEVYNSTGDGFLIVLSSQIDVSDVIKSAFVLQKLLRENNIIVRQAVGQGDCYIVNDFQGKTDAVGSVINETARICSLGDGNHILVSSSLRQSSRSSFQGQSWEAVAEYQNVSLRHIEDKTISVLSLYDSTDNLGNPDTPKAIQIGMTVFKEQAPSLDDVTQFIRDNPNGHAKLIEYSSLSIGSILEELRMNHWTADILLKHPGFVSVTKQKGRIKEGYKNIRSQFDQCLDSIEVRCYTLPASIRGRSFNDKLINIGWYSYTDSNSADQPGIYGSKNCMINSLASTSNGEHLKNMFTIAFDSLWTSSSTKPADRVLYMK